MPQAPLALVTGSTAGLGRAVAVALGSRGYTVLCHGRDPTRGAAIVAEIEAAGGRAHFLAADFASLAQVRELAAAVRAGCPQLDLLINNAGIGTGARGARRQESADGHELTLAINHLAGFLLTGLLLPLLARPPRARIVNVASAAQYPLDFDNLMLKTGWSGLRAYAQSKLAQILFTFELPARLPHSGVTANCLHPATLMDTGLVRLTGASPRSTVAEGAAAVLHLATAPAYAERSGVYCDGLNTARAHAQAYDPVARQRLWALSAALTGLGHTAAE